MSETVHQLYHEEALVNRFPDGVLFYSFYGQPDMNAIFEYIARSYGVDTQQDLRLAAAQALSNKQALLILDGCESAEGLHQLWNFISRCGVVVVTRDRRDRKGEMMSLGLVDADDAIAIIQQWAGELADDRNAVREICELVGFLPLALRLVGIYMKETEKYADEYLPWLKKSPLSALDHGRRRKRSVPLF